MSIQVVLALPTPDEATVDPVTTSLREFLGSRIQLGLKNTRISVVHEINVNEFRSGDDGIARIDIAVELHRLLGHPREGSSLNAARPVLITSLTGVGEPPPSVEFWLTQVPDLIVIGINTESGQIEQYNHVISCQPIGETVDELVQALLNLETVE